MIIGVDKKELQKQREQKYREYAALLNSNDPSKDELNALKSEIKYIDNQLIKIDGLNEKMRIEQVKKKKSGVEEKNINNYYAFKNKYEKISKIKQSYVKMINTIEKIQNETYIENLNNNVVKVKI